MPLESRPQFQQRFVMLWATVSGVIARLTLQGHSSKSMARLLDISPETVKVYRKKVHQKLEISSQGELFSIFLEGLKNMPVGRQGDPLEFVEDMPGKP